MSLTTHLSYFVSDNNSPPTAPAAGEPEAAEAVENPGNSANSVFSSEAGDKPSDLSGKFTRANAYSMDGRCIGYAPRYTAHTLRSIAALIR